MSDLPTRCPSAITKIEQGERRVPVDDLAVLAAALNVSPPRLLVDGRVAVEKLAQYRDSGFLQPITDAVFDALLRDRLDPVWIEYQLELAISILPALQELLGEVGDTDTGRAVSSVNQTSQR